MRRKRTENIVTLDQGDLINIWHNFLWVLGICWMDIFKAYQITDQEQISVKLEMQQQTFLSIKYLH